MKPALACTVTMATACGCGGEPQTARFTPQVEEDWPLQLAEDQFAPAQATAFGTLFEERVGVRDLALVRCREGNVTVRVEQIVVAKGDGAAAAARLDAPAGAAIRLKGIDPAANWTDDRVVAPGSSH